MSFSDVLSRLRNAAVGNKPEGLGSMRSKSQRVVERKDIEELLFHFDRLDCAARDEITERLEQRLANAEAQEPPTLRLLQPHKDENGLNVIDGPMGFRYPGTIELIARPLRPAPPATGERVKELEKVKSKLASAMRAETHPKAKDYLIDEAIEIIDAAIAASKADGNGGEV